MNHGQILVDEKYKWLLEKYNWDCSTGYPRYEIRGTTKKISLHRIIVSLEEKDPLLLFQPDIIIDHKDRNKLNSQYENLRRASQSLNRINSKLDKRNTSGYKGVTFDKRLRKWRVRYSDKNKNRKSAGLFECKHEAARCYNEKVKEIWGEDIALNIIKDDNNGNC